MSSAGMDFSKFRQTGEFSDIKIAVADQEFNLHKFPLFAKSDYLCANAKPEGNVDITLEDFPGGVECFGIVADFFYSMKVSITKENVIDICCAAEYLKMTGYGNLMDVSIKSLKDIVVSAKLSRCTKTLIDLLVQCSTYHELSEKAGIVDIIEDAIVECWLRLPTKFSSVASKDSSYVRDSEWGQLLDLPVGWFAALITRAREIGVRQSRLADMIVKYIMCVLAEDSEETSSNEETPDDTDNTSATKATEEETETEQETEEDTDVQPVEEPKKPKERRAEPASSEELGKVLDKLIPELPQQAHMCERISLDWVIKVLKISTTNGCKCRPILVKLAGELLAKSSDEELSFISPSVLHDVISEQVDSDQESVEKTNKLVDVYLAQLARKDVLTVETYNLLVPKAEGESRKCHDKLYDIVEILLKSENAKVTDAQKTELLETIDFTKVSEKTLYRALENPEVPDERVAKGAVKLCGRLRGELDAAKYTAIKQDRELRTLKAALDHKSNPTSTSWSKPIDAAYTDTTDALKPNYDFLDYRSAVEALSSGRIAPTSTGYSSTYAQNACDWDREYEDDLDYYYYEKYERPNRTTGTRPRRSKYLNLPSYSSRYYLS